MVVSCVLFSVSIYKSPSKMTLSSSKMLSALRTMVVFLGKRPPPKTLWLSLQYSPEISMLPRVSLFGEEGWALRIAKGGL